MQPLRGIALKLLAVLAFFLMATLIKVNAAEIPAGEAVFFRSLFSLPVIIIWMIWQGNLRTGLRTSMPLGHVWRGLIGSASMALGFVALGLLTLPEATVIGYAAPILTVILASMFLGEQIRAVRITAVVLGLIGVCIVIYPRLTLDAGDMSLRETLGVACALGAALCSALAQIQVRKLVATEQTAAIVFYFLSTASVLSLMTLPLGWAMPDAKVLFMLIMTGVLGGIGQILLTSCYRYADTGVIAPFEYTSILLAVSVGYLLFDEVPSTNMLAGSAVIIMAGVIIILRERALGIERAKQKSAGTH